MYPLLDSIFPEPCVCCSGAFGSSPLMLCQACRARLNGWIGRRHCTSCGIPVAQFLSQCERCRQTDYAFDWSRAAFPYDGVAGALLRAFKFGGRRCISRPIAELMATHLVACGFEGWDDAVLVPVPSVRGHIRQRGFETSTSIATHLAGFRATHLWRPLVQTGKVSQKQLRFDARFAHASNSIGLQRVVGGIAAKAILVDDVFTTGATLSRCAALLKRIGVERVGAVVFVMEEE